MTGNMSLKEGVKKLSRQINAKIDRLDLKQRVEIAQQLGCSNIPDVVLRTIEKYHSKVDDKSNP